MLNQCQFIGNLGADPETRSFSNGGQVCNLRIAVTEKWKTKDGEKKERTEWVQVCVFSDGLAKVCQQYLRKGSKIFVSGKMATRKWQDQSGNERYSTEIHLNGPQAQMIMLDAANSGGQQPTNASGNNANNSGGQSSQSDDLDDDFDDVPFASCDYSFEHKRRTVL